MKRLSVAMLLCAFVFGVVPVLAQNPNYDVGPIWRVNYLQIKPGLGDAFWKDFREHIKPVLEEEKKAGLITDFKAFVNPTADSPHDWDVAICVLYANWAALDQIDAKAASIVAKHYGSREAAFEAARKRAEIREVIASRLAREVTPK